MKKYLSILLACLLALTVFGAAAEETAPVEIKVHDGLTISVVVPEGYTFSGDWNGEILYADLTPADPAAPAMILSVAASEEYGGVTINDLSEDELNSLIAVCTADYASPSYAISETTHGTKLIVLDENSDADEYVEIVTLYQGYFVQVLMEPTDESQLTEDQIAVAVQLLSDMKFVTK